MSTLYAVTSAAKWSLHSVISNNGGFVRTGPGQISQSSPSGDPNSAIHAVYPNAPITLTLPTAAPAPPPPPPFSPLDLANCDIWFDASDSTQITASPFQFKNKGLLAGTASATAGVTTGVRTMNSKNLVSFGAQRYMTITLALPSTSNKTFFVVAQNQTTITTTYPGAYFYWITAPVSSAFGVGLENGGGTGLLKTEMNYIDYPMYAYTPINSRFAIGTPYYISTRNSSTPADGFIKINNTSITPLGNNWTASFGTGSYAYDIGNRNYPNAFDLAEMILYDRVLTDAQCAQVVSYLQARWGFA